MAGTLSVLIGTPGVWTSDAPTMDAELSDEQFYAHAAYEQVPAAGPEGAEEVPSGEPPNLSDQPPAGTNMHQWAADILVQAWQKVMGAVPSPRALQAAQAVAKLESAYGWPKNEGWKGHHNWGAVHAVCRVDGRVTNCQHNGGCIKGFMSTDRVNGEPKPTCFAHFETNLDGASHFLTQLLVRRPRVAQVIDSGDAFQIALAMRRSRYFMFCASTTCQTEETYRKEAATYASIIMGSAKVIAKARGTEVLLVLGVPEFKTAPTIPENGAWPHEVTDTTDRVPLSQHESTLGPVSGLAFGVALGAVGVLGYRRWMK